MSGRNTIRVAKTTLGPIEYLEREDPGDSSKGVILTIHGAMGGYDQSDILGRTIGPEGYRYLSISRPGYLGTPLRGREAPEAQADLIAAFLDSLELKEAIVFAISGGGYSALYFALRHFERCKALVLCSTTGGKNEVPVPFAFHVMKLLARIPFFPEMMKRKIEKDVEGSLKKSVSHPEIFDRTIQNQEVMRLFKELSMGTMNQMAKRLPGTVNDIQITRSRNYPLKDIRVPTLVIHGSDDPLVPFREHGRRLAREIPGARLYLAEQGEHVTIFTHRTEVKNEVSDFLTDLS
ncbi:alpha/beta fold hydrolase [Desulfospira joergensenii]|uniref:alpha/beta fold hydrolase n=1 Tax=Desulfospira joergensenii TaxID=53329 RepID=UPI0003B74F8E|nr:alpha/beta hydrolase [Desulfospira joergensenii]